MKDQTLRDPLSLVRDHWISEFPEDKVVAVFFEGWFKSDDPRPIWSDEFGRKAYSCPHGITARLIIEREGEHIQVNMNAFFEDGVPVWSLPWSEVGV